eukprot:5807178-Alexandrium_andersonii.AAC.1
MSAGTLGLESAGTLGLESARTLGLESAGTLGHFRDPPADPWRWICRSNGSAGDLGRRGRCCPVGHCNAPRVGLSD